jgi:hypothetical protein
MGAITESFIAGSAKSVNIVNEETAVNVAKQEMAALNYCRNGGTVTGVCKAFKGGFWNNPASYIFQQDPTNVNNECFYTIVMPKNNIVFEDNGGTVCMSSNCPPPSSLANYIIQAIVKTGWFASNAGGICPTTPPSSYPYVTLSTVYANY